MTALSEMVLNEVNGEDHYGSQPALPPPEDPRPEDMDALLVAELNKLSIIEREHVLQDIHGVSDIVDEEPEFVARCLAELNTEVTMIDNKPAYLQAKAQNPEYVSNLDFRLMFLRADSFIPKLAAIRLVAFFEAKLELFGTEKLTKTILLSDMDKDDIGCLETGYSQLLPGRDRAGRALCTILPMVHNEHTTLRSKLRAFYYILMTATEDLETQKRGIVGLAYNVGPASRSDRHAVWKNGKLCASVPLRFVAMHYCYDDPRMKTLLNVAMFVFGRHIRMRCRTHCGTDMECMYKLMTFGIPSDALPISPSGELKIKRQSDWLNVRRKQEAVSGKDTRNRIVVPGPHDVLLGRGKPLQKHTGNLRYHHTIESYEDRYESAMKLEKTTIAKEIVQQIKDAKGRFLKQDSTGWVEIDDDAARYKVSHTFRNHRISMRSNQKKTTEAKTRNADDSCGSSGAEDSSVVGTEAPVDNKRLRLLAPDIAESMDDFLME